MYDILLELEVLDGEIDMNTKVCAMLLCMLVLVDAALAAANVAPTVTIVSTAMRPGTSLMDVVYKITDPDDATVKVRALAFKDGTRSFSNVIRPVTFVESTQTNIGDSITTGVNHTLTWDVRADWNIDLANVKFEVLARDNRGLLPLNWITIPATTNTPAVTISLNVPTDSQVLDALFWLYAAGDPEVVLTNGSLKGTTASGLFNGEVLVSGASLQPYSPALFLYKRLNLTRATFKEKDLAISARAGISDRFSLHAANRLWNESELGKDPTAVMTNIVNARWVKLTYANGAITMVDRFSGKMWIYNRSPNGQDVSADWYTALSYCSDLVYAGYDDWILPDSGSLVAMKEQTQFFMLGGGWTTTWDETNWAHWIYIWSSTTTYSLSAQAWDGWFKVWDRNRWDCYGVWPMRGGQ
jgi:hypothetical protein